MYGKIKLILLMLLLAILFNGCVTKETILIHKEPVIIYKDKVVYKKIKLPMNLFEDIKLPEPPNKVKYINSNYKKRNDMLTLYIIELMNEIKDIKLTNELINGKIKEYNK